MEELILFSKACSTHGGRKGMHIEIWWGNQKETDHLQDLDVGRRTILRSVFEKYEGVVRTWIIRLRIGASGWLL
jgi:hypothetical protein